MANRLGNDAGLVPNLAGAPILAFSVGAVQNIAYTTATTLLTNPLAAGTKLIRLAATTDCYVKVATGSPTAAAADLLLLAGQEYLYPIQANDAAIKVAAIGRVAAGILNVAELN